jgi:DNA-binding GntR family transcriptional regulator
MTASTRTRSRAPARSPKPAAGPSRRESFSENAYHELRARILDSRLPSGEVFTEEQLASMLKMSRTPAREAMLRLAKDGLVEVRPRHGMRIKPVSVADIREIYEVLTGWNPQLPPSLRNGRIKETASAVCARRSRK